MNLIKKPVISLIVAMGSNNAIGKDGQLLWLLPEDLRYFKKVTEGKNVLMGRKTWESIPDKFRPLAKRKNIVISRNLTFVAEGAICVNSMQEALQQTDSEEVFIIGGGKIYQESLPFADKLYVTQVFMPFKADTFFPVFTKDDWEEIERQKQQEEHALRYEFVVYQRKQT